MYQRMALLTSKQTELIIPLKLPNLTDVLFYQAEPWRSHDLQGIHPVMTLFTTDLHHKLTETLSSQDPSGMVTVTFCRVEHNRDFWQILIRVYIDEGLIICDAIEWFNKLETALIDKAITAIRRII